MWADIVDLHEFYESDLGQVARHMVRRAIRKLWPDVKGQTVLGVGYATPYLRHYRSEAERVLAFMPAPQGVMAWPDDGPNAAALVEENALPLPDASVDRVLLVHGLESSQAQRGLLEEIWRVMAGDGRLLVVAPNRRGVWARSDRSPFGLGHPFGQNELSRLLRHHGFTPTARERALFVPPLRSRTLLHSAAAWERIGAQWCPRFSGIVLAEAGKQIWAVNARRAEETRRPFTAKMPQAVPTPRSEVTN